MRVRQHKHTDNRKSLPRCIASLRQTEIFPMDVLAWPISQIIGKLIITFVVEFNGKNMFRYVKLLKICPYTIP